LSKKVLDVYLDSKTLEPRTLTQAETEIWNAGPWTTLHPIWKMSSVQ